MLSNTPSPGLNQGSEIWEVHQFKRATTYGNAGLPSFTAMVREAEGVPGIPISLLIHRLRA